MFQAHRFRRAAASAWRCSLPSWVSSVLDGLLFRTPFYPSILEPDSSTGVFELTLWREQQAQTRNGDNMVVTLGDSRFAYSPRLANELTAKTGYVFRHAGVAGTDVRSWYYMLRDLDPTARRIAPLCSG